MKIVINTRFGTFNLSDYAKYLYMRASGQTPYIYIPASGSVGVNKNKFKRVELSELNSLPSYRIAVFTPEYQGDIIDHYPNHSIDFRTIDRTDSILISIVEAIGYLASGPLSKIDVANIPDGTEYVVDKYDGLETIVYKNEVKWNVAKTKDPVSKDTKKNIEDIWDLIKPAPKFDPTLQFVYEK